MSEVSLYIVSRELDPCAGVPAYLALASQRFVSKKICSSSGVQECTRYPIRCSTDILPFGEKYFDAKGQLSPTIPLLEMVGYPPNFPV